ncbi:MAG TPA: hypothetical protein VL283_03235, partial [Candidatus Baltobacteraceae bacterium]|nr:hypothetical protein [Candidatus Baltobacteraceae bacterium]
YAAHMEMFMDAGVDTFDGRTATQRPLKQIASATTILLGQFMKPEGGSDPDFLTALLKPGATRIGRLLHQGIVDRASRDIRLRSGLQRAPRPMEFSSRARADGVFVTIENYGFDGSVTVSRETEPAERGDRAWRINVRSGRWTAVVWPWQLEPVF